MTRLYRPHVPLSIRVHVAQRALGTSCLIRQVGESMSSFLDRCLLAVSILSGCEVSDLRLDHDPPLGARPQERRGLSKKTFYTPGANDPDHLFYRPHGPQFDGSHLIKTNVRGDHGQHPDRVLIKKNRRIERGPKPKRGPKIQSRGFASETGTKLMTVKQKWPSRPFERGAK